MDRNSDDEKSNTKYWNMWDKKEFYHSTNTNIYSIIIQTYTPAETYGCLKLLNEEKLHKVFS
jgi:hypothetical protein